MAVVRVPAFRELYQDNAAFVWRSLRRLGVAPAHLEDACQEVFVVVHRKLASFDGQSPRSWLFAIALRVAADHRKRAFVRREQATGDVEGEVVSAPQHAAVERVQAREFLEKVLDELDDDKRAVFVLFELEGLGMNEIALAVGCPLQTAYSRLHAARRRVRALVQQARLAGEWP